MAGRDRRNARETIPAEGFSDSRTTCGAERMKTRKKGETAMVTFAGNKHAPHRKMQIQHPAA